MGLIQMLRFRICFVVGVFLLYACAVKSGNPFASKPAPAPKPTDERVTLGLQLAAGEVDLIQFSVVGYGVAQQVGQFEIVNRFDPALVLQAGRLADVSFATIELTLPPAQSGSEPSHFLMLDESTSFVQKGERSLKLLPAELGSQASARGIALGALPQGTDVARESEVSARSVRVVIGDSELDGCLRTFKLDESVDTCVLPQEFSWVVATDPAATNGRSPVQDAGSSPSPITEQPGPVSDFVVDPPSESPAGASGGGSPGH